MVRLSTLLTRGYPWLLLSIATGLWLTSWGWLVYHMAIQPSPWQVVTSYYPDGSSARGSFGYRCWGETLVRDDVLWRWPCVHEASAEARPFLGESPAYLVEIDLRQRTARPLAETAGATSRQAIQGLAEHPNGDLALMVGSSEQFYHVRPNGRVTGVEFPIAMSADAGMILGLAWVGDGLEAVFRRDRDGVVTLFRYQPGQGWQMPRQSAGLSCSAAEVCRLQVAYRENNVWQLLYSRWPRQPVKPATVSVELLLGTLEAAPREIGRVGLQASGSALESQFWMTETGEVGDMALSIDRSLGNLINPRRWRSLPLVRGADGAWRPLELPVQALVSQFGRSQPDLESGLYQRGTDRLIWIPQVTGIDFSGTRAIAHQGVWYHLSISSQFGSRLGRLGETPGPSLLNDSFGSAQAAPLAPASDGGFWYVSQYGNHIHVGPDKHRADPLSPAERIWRLNEAGWLYRHAFFEEAAGWKVLSGQLMLWTLPIWLLIVSGWRAVRASTTPWREVVVPIALGSSAISVLGASGFHQLAQFV